MGFIFDVIIQFFLEIFGIERDDRRARKRQQSGQIDCGVRVIVGSQEGLKNRWKVSRTFVYPGRLEFGRRAPILVQVGAVVTERQRHPRGWEAWLIADTTWQIVELVTDSATLEWAVPEDKLEWAMARVRGTEIHLHRRRESPEYQASTSDFRESRGAADPYVFYGRARPTCPQTLCDDGPMRELYDRPAAAAILVLRRCRFPL
jgi:hypothetical protein